MGGLVSRNQTDFVSEPLLLRWPVGKKVGIWIRALKEIQGTVELCNPL